MKKYICKTIINGDSVVDYLSFKLHEAIHVFNLTFNLTRRKRNPNQSTTTGKPTTTAVPFLITAQLDGLRKSIIQRTVRSIKTRHFAIRIDETDTK